MKLSSLFTIVPVVSQDFRTGNIDTAFIPKHEKELAEVSMIKFHLLITASDMLHMLLLEHNQQNDV